MGKKNDNYIKIETPFKRDIEGTKKMVYGDFRSESLEYLKNNIFQWTEKIDGMNIVVKWDGHNVTFEGHNKNSQIAGDLIQYLESKFSTNEAEELLEQTFGEEAVELYGEGYGTGIQKGGDYRKDKSFIMFDIYLPNQNLWLNRYDVNEIAKMFGIESVPIIFEGTLNEAIDYVKANPNSTIGIAKMEGLVGRPKVELFDRRGNRIIVKVKCCDFCN
jgi:hypothetical protein